jgi:orotidine-5'-phosphate decarboxylase
MANPCFKLVVALVVSSAAEAQRLVNKIGDIAGFYKVGKQLFTAEGPQLVRDLVSSGHRVFLDLKFHDIPNTVFGAVQESARLGVSMLTVHTSGGSKMLGAAVEAAAASEAKPLVLGVTVLTSIGQDGLAEIGINDSVENQVVRLAGLALKAGCGGVVASAREAAKLRAVYGGNFAIVTPGVRPAGAEAGDQARVVTPGDAIAAGATHIVVGRPITQASDPARAAAEIAAQL